MAAAPMVFRAIEQKQGTAPIDAGAAATHAPAPAQPAAVDPLSALWSTVSQIRFDAVAWAGTGAGALLGLMGIRFLPMLFLVLAWEAGAYALMTWGPPAILEYTRGLVRPALSDAGFIFAGWIAGRLVHALIKRRRQTAIFYGVEDDPTKVVSSYDVIGEEPALAYASYGASYGSSPSSPAYTRQTAARSYARSASGSVVPAAAVSYGRSGAGGGPSYTRVPTSLLNAERWPEDGRIPFDLSEAEAEAVRAALTRRLAELRQSTHNDRRGGTGYRASAWQMIGLLEALLARLPPSTRSVQWDAA